jgi:hypothetical protein
VVLKAKTENQLLKTFDGQGNTKLERADIDFDILASLLTFDDGVTYFTPLRGDLLEKDFGAVTAQFQVMPVGGSEPAWRYLEANRSMLRVHCKFNGNV